MNFSIHIILHSYNIIYRTTISYMLFILKNMRNLWLLSSSTMLMRIDEENLSPYSWIASILVMTTKMGSYISHKFLLLFHVHRGMEKIKTKVPWDHWEKVEALGFNSPNTIVITALEKLISEPELKSSGKEQEIKIQELENQLEDEKRRTQELQKELEIRMEETQKQIKDLKKILRKRRRGKYTWKKFTIITCCRCKLWLSKNRLQHLEKKIMMEILVTSEKPIF